MAKQEPLNILFFVEGFTDIRVVVGLSRLGRVTLVVPSRQFTESGLRERVAASSAELVVEEIPGGRLMFLLRSLRYLWNNVRRFDVILAQEVLRGALNANLIGWLRGVPVINYMGIAPVEYFRCRRERRQISRVTAWLGEAVIRTLMSINGLLADRWLAGGQYLLDIAARNCSRSQAGLYYGVDTDFYCPVDEATKSALRCKLDLPPKQFLIFMSSRISHEKDPETVLQAVSIARSKGLDAVVLNLGGGYLDFLRLAHELHLPDYDLWVLGRPAAHPMTELAGYYQAADLLAQASLAEGLGISPLEALACGIPVVATAVGGMACHLGPFARLTPRRDPTAMAEEILWVANHSEEAHTQALIGREYVIREWNRDKAFADLRQILKDVSGRYSK